MYEVFTEAGLVRFVAEARANSVPGYRGRLPLRVARPDPQLITTVVPRAVFSDLVPEAPVDAVWAGRTCPECGRVFAYLDHAERLPNEPWRHRRCAKVGGNIRAWIPLATINAWMYRAGATYAGDIVREDFGGNPPNFEFRFADLPAGLAAMFTTTNRGVLFLPDGTVNRANDRIGASS